MTNDNTERRAALAKKFDQLRSAALAASDGAHAAVVSGWASVAAMCREAKALLLDEPTPLPQADGHPDHEASNGTVVPIRAGQSKSGPWDLHIATACPSCHRPSLVVSATGHLWCTNDDCLERRAGKAIADLQQRAQVAEELAQQDQRDAAQLQVLHALLASDQLTDQEKTLAALTIASSALGPRLRGRA